MNETLMAVYIGILCAAMVVLLAWFVIQLVLEFRRKNRGDDKNIVQLDGRYYRVVPLSGANEEVAATEAPAEEIAEPVQEEPAPVAESAEPTSAQEQAETAAEGTEFVAVDESTVVLRLRKTSRSKRRILPFRRSKSALRGISSHMRYLGKRA